jgi:hypothetical protein
MVVTARAGAAEVGAQVIDLGDQAADPPGAAFGDLAGGVGLDLGPGGLRVGLGLGGGHLGLMSVEKLVRQVTAGGYGLVSSGGQAEFRRAARLGELGPQLAGDALGPLRR